MPVEATRCAVGVALVFVASIIFHNASAGLLASIGALYTGLAASSGVYHVRIRTMITNGVMIGSATTLGTLVGIHPVPALIAVLMTAFSTSLFASSGRAASTISAQTTALLCIVIGLKLPPSGAFQNGLLVLTGAAVQLFLLTVVWRMRPGIPEARAVADAYDSLARFVLGLKNDHPVETANIPPAPAIQEARALLTEAENYPRQSEHYLLLEALRRAEALRAALVGFAEAHQRYMEIDRLSRVRSHRILRSISRCMKVIEDRARSGRLDQEPVLLKVPTFDTDNEVSANYRQWLLILSELIQDCCHLSRPEIPAPIKRTAIRTRAKSLFTKLTRLPDIHVVRSVVFQHAVRYAITVELAFAIAEHWTRSHSYWLPLTAALVLRQDYGSTLQRAVARLLGTLLGLVIAIAVIDLFHPSTLVLEFLTLAMTWFAFASVQASYMAMTVAVTGYVVYSIAISGTVTGEISGMRLVASVFGIVIAVASYFLWPAWNWNQIWDTLRSAAQAQSHYVSKVLGTKPGAVRNQSELDEARAEARSLRIQSENLVESAKMHPLGRTRANLAKAEKSLLALEENAAVILASQTEWNIGQPESDLRLQEALQRAEKLKTQLVS